MKRCPLLPIIQKHVKPGSVVLSDKWRAYGTTEQLPEGYELYTVNHSENFVDPVSGAHTQTIESTWQKLKAKHKQRYGTHRKCLASYLDKFIWRRRFGDQPFYHFWKCVSQLYDISTFPKNEE
ncbi:hypothetical protein L596_025580 [Steinernema carpocapsae]|uniref:ISXO2-like transposase domain-containing protein n=1 Tax=Steinernema carpocapsae TaxID=34508 RepID=A0A4U5M867_STECR|nr:hypothetical protein L596_025580 [Steinernema carpocapsae]